MVMEGAKYPFKDDVVYSKEERLQDNESAIICGNNGSAQRVELTQQALIKKILSTTGLVEDCNPNCTSATEPLEMCPDGMPMTESWSHPSVTGMS